MFIELKYYFQMWCFISILFAEKNLFFSNNRILFLIRSSIIFPGTNNTTEMETKMRQAPSIMVFHSSSVTNANRISVVWKFTNKAHCANSASISSKSEINGRTLLYKRTEQRQIKIATIIWVAVLFLINTSNPVSINLLTHSKNSNHQHQGS